MSEYIRKLLLDSETITNDNKQLSLFFNNSSMGKILDVFLNNQDVKMNIVDILNIAELSRKSIWTNMPKLLKSGIILEEQHEHWKFYLLNKKNTQAKQISQFRDTLVVKDVEQITRRVHFRHEQERRTRQPKKVSGEV